MFGPLKIIRDPETAILLIYTAIVIVGFYVITPPIAVQFHNMYGLSTTLQGLLFIMEAVDNILAAVTNSYTPDWNYRRHTLKVGRAVSHKKRDDLHNMPIECARLEIGMPMFATGAIFIMIYGWLLEMKVIPARLIVMLVESGYTLLAGFNTPNVLLVDLHHSRATTASAASNLVRCLLGAGASVVTNPMIEAMGNGLSFTLVGLVERVALPRLWMTMTSGLV